jgi:hypothetical protein
MYKQWMNAKCMWKHSIMKYVPKTSTKQCKICRIKPAGIWVNQITKDWKFQNMENLSKIKQCPGIYPPSTLRYAAKRQVKSIWKHSTKQNLFWEILAHQLIYNMTNKHVLLSPRKYWKNKSAQQNTCMGIMKLVEAMRSFLVPTHNLAWWQFCVMMK